MQNYWNLYRASKQQQLYGPVNYRDFQETGPGNLNWSEKTALSLAPCKVIRIVKYGKFLLVESANRGIQHKESEIPLTRLESGIPIPLTRYPQSTIRNPRRGLQNLSLFRIIFLGENCWNKVRHTEFLQPITKRELKEMFRTSPKPRSPVSSANKCMKRFLPRPFVFLHIVLKGSSFKLIYWLIFSFSKVFTRYIACR